MRKNILVIICVVAMMGIAGCSKRDSGEDIKNKLHNVDDEEYMNTEAIEDVAYDIPDKIEYVAESSGGTPYTVKVDATVEANTLDNIGIYGVKPVEFDDEYIASFAGKWFDNGEYETLKPYNICSMEELEAEKLRYQEIVQYYEDINSYGYKTIGIRSWGNLCSDPKINIAMIDEAITVYEDSNVIEADEDQILYQSETLSLATEDIITTQNGKLRGLVDGDEWELSASCSPVSSNADSIIDFSGGYKALEGDYGFISMQPVYFESSVVEYVNTGSMATNMYGENICDMESAQEVAAEALDKLGFEGYENIYTAAMVVDISEAKDESNVILDGYCFVYSLDYGELNFDYMSSPFVGGDCGITVDGLETGVVPSYIMVSVTTEGIYNINFNLQYITEEEMAKDATLMDFSQIESIAKNYILDNASSFYQGVTIDKVELKYVNITYGDGNYAVVPVWLFGYSEAGLYCNNNKAFGVNALDGSIVKINHFSYNTYDPYIF